MSSVNMHNKDFPKDMADHRPECRYSSHLQLLIRMGLTGHKNPPDTSYRLHVLQVSPSKWRGTLPEIPLGDPAHISSKCFYPLMSSA